MSPGREVAREIINIRQGKKSLNYAIDRQWLELSRPYLRGLSLVIKDQLIALDLPDELSLIALTSASTRGYRSMSGNTQDRDQLTSLMFLSEPLFQAKPEISNPQEEPLQLG